MQKKIKIGHMSYEKSIKTEQRNGSDFSKNDIHPPLF